MAPEALLRLRHFFSRGRSGIQRIQTLTKISALVLE